MPKPSKFSGTIEAAWANIREKVVVGSAEDVLKLSRKIKLQVENEYDAFFIKMEDFVGSTATPALISGFTFWEPIGDFWQGQKDAADVVGEEHYRGLTSVLGAAAGRKLGRAKNDGVARIRGAQRGGLTEPFESFVQSQTENDVRRIFGPIKITYTISGTGIRTETVQAENLITNLRVIANAGKRKGQLAPLPKNLKIEIGIEAFTNLKALKLGKGKVTSQQEFFIVDYILKRLDPSNEKQWVKINSRFGLGRRRRPIRAVIAPLISWYFKVGFIQAVQRALRK